MSIKPAGLPESNFERLEKEYPQYIQDVLEFSKIPTLELYRLFKYEAAVRVTTLKHYIESGKKHFHLNDDLTWLLSQTRAEVMLNHIMPFDCVYLSFEGELDFDGQQVEGVYVGQGRPLNGGAAIGSKIIINFIICFRGLESKFYQHVVALNEHIQYSEWIHQIKGDTYTVSRQKVVDLISLTLNALLYISTPTAVRYKPSEVLTDKQKKRVRKNPRRRRQLEKLDQSVVILGPEARASRISRTPHQGGTVRSHLRRGHWRRQWVGSKLDQDGNKQLGEKQIPIWVLPTWVSGDGEPAVKTKYIVK